jgi:hypothetical protein
MRADDEAQFVEFSLLSHDNTAQHFPTKEQAQGGVDAADSEQRGTWKAKTILNHVGRFTTSTARQIYLRRQLHTISAATSD